MTPPQRSSIALTPKAFTDVRLLDLRRDLERIAPGVGTKKNPN
jgi:hypothetical protein